MSSDTLAQDHFQNQRYLLEQTTNAHQPLSFDTNQLTTPAYSYNMTAGQKAESSTVHVTGNGNELCDLSLSRELQQMDDDEEYVEHDLDGDSDDSEDDDEVDESGSSSSEIDDDDDGASEDGQQRKKSKADRSKNLLKDKPNEKGSLYLDLTKRMDEHQLNNNGSFENNDEEMRLAALKQLHEQNFITITQKDEITLQMQEGKHSNVALFQVRRAKKLSQGYNSVNFKRELV
jgi:hypothetical protein